MKVGIMKNLNLFTLECVRCRFKIHKQNLTLKDKKCAFTLAEVLITLGIIGIIAAMTFPSIVGRYREKATVAQLKKSYSLLSQVFNKIVYDTGSDPKDWGMGDMYDANSHIIMANKFVPYLKIAQNCVGKSTEYTKKHCIDNTRYSDIASMASVRLMDGTTIVFRNWTSSCNWKFGNNKYLQNICGEIIVDTNGQKNPNILGNDMFEFYFTNYGIYPAGTELEIRLTFDKYCDKEKDWEEAIGGYFNGSGCTAWVLQNENQEYLRCSDLSWNKKHKCK